MDGAMNPKSAAEGRREIRVVTWNVLAPVFADNEEYPGIDRETLSWDARLPRILEFLTEGCVADVVMLTEVQRSTHATLAADEGLKAVYDLMPLVPHNPRPNRKDGSQDGNALLVRKGVFASFEQMKIKVAGDRNHGVLARAVLPDGQHVLVCATHLDCGDTPLEDAEVAQLRVEQVASILAAIDEELQGDEVVVWGGDFNCPSTAPELAAVFEAGYTLSSRTEGMTEFSCATFGTAEEGWHSPIDHLFVRHARPHIEVKAEPLEEPALMPEEAFDHGLAEHPDDVDEDALADCLQWALDTYGSDHLPVGCSVVLACKAGRRCKGCQDRRHGGAGLVPPPC